MPRTLEQLEAWETKSLEPYSQFSADSRGRRYQEEVDPGWRTQFQRDRDRVIHSRAFRRLEYKTQVFLNGTGDHLRTRLTHTMEVAAISRNIARALGLNEDLTETIALAHDLGHSPFGHTGEAALDELMAEHGGFEHNRQSLRIVEKLEQKYPTFPGLNLTWESREGLVKHRTGFDLPIEPVGFDSKSPSLEAQVANLADEITYYSHDLDDGLDSKLLNPTELSSNVEIWKEASHAVKDSIASCPLETKHYFTIRCIIDQQVRDVVNTSHERITEAKVASADEVRKLDEPLIGYSSELARKNQQLRAYLYKNLYYNPGVHDPNLAAGNRLKELFALFTSSPELAGLPITDHVESVGLHRAVCDYLAGMTDRFAINEHQRLTP